jgi:hypothetical protein
LPEVEKCLRLADKFEIGDNPTSVNSFALKSSDWPIRRSINNSSSERRVGTTYVEHLFCVINNVSCHSQSTTLNEARYEASHDGAGDDATLSLFRFWPWVRKPDPNFVNTASRKSVKEFERITVNDPQVAEAHRFDINHEASNSWRVHISGDEINLWLSNRRGNRCLTSATPNLYRDRCQPAKDLFGRYGRSFNIESIERQKPLKRSRSSC